MASPNINVATRLHNQRTCHGGEDDIERMRKYLSEDPNCLEDLQSPPMFCGALTPLQSAVHANHERCVQFLIDNGASLETQNEAGYTALYIAIYGKLPSLISLLLKRGASPNYIRSDRSCPIHRKNWYMYLACSFGFVEIAESLALYGAVPEVFWERGYSSAAQVSALKNHPECLLLALKAGAVTDFYQIPWTQRYESLRDYSLLHFSVQGKSFHSKESTVNVSYIWAMLRAFGARFDFKDSRGRTLTDHLTNRHVPLTHGYILIDNLKHVMCNPLSLQSLSRIAVRNVLGVAKCNKKIPLLKCVPPAVRDFLNYDGMTIEDFWELYNVKKR